MEQYDLLLNIAAKKEGKDFFTLTISTKEGKSATAKIDKLPWDLASHMTLPGGAELGTFLYNILVNDNCWTIVYDHVVSMEKIYARGSLLLEIEASEFFQLPWEDIFLSPELSLLKARFQILRYLSAASTIVTKPLKLPIDVLIVSDSKKDIINRLPTEKTLRYFRANKATGVSTDRVKKLLGQFEFDIVHITGKAMFDKTGDCIFFPGIEGEAIKADELSSLLKNCKARFLVLHCTGGEYGALLHFAHLLLHKNGPTILVTAQPYEGFQWTTVKESSVFNDFDNLYIEIVHNVHLAYISPLIPIEFRPALLLALGGGDVLSISMQVFRVQNQFENHVLYASHVLEKIHLNIIKAESIGDLKKADRLREHLQYLGLYIESNEPEFRNELNYAHESGGMEPLKKMETINTEFARRLKNVESLTKRVVNCWFRSGDKIIKSDEKLEPNNTYNYDIQIGAALEGSILQNATPFPDKELSPFFSEIGIPLQIELFSTDLEIPESSRTLNLPTPPDESDTISFSIKTFDKNYIARMRVGIYYKQNLIQSLMVQSIIGNPETSTSLKGNSAEVDFSLSNTLTDLDRLPERTLNIAVNDSGNSTHSLYIAGAQLKDQFNFGEGELTAAIKASRTSLQDICSTRDSKGNLADYRFEPNNIGNEKDFIDDVKKLAWLGYKLYAQVIVGKRSHAFKQKLEEALEKPGATIQISSTQSSKLVFPWALIYDKPLLSGDKSVCPQFLADLKKKDPPGVISSPGCILNGCPNKADNKIVCPSNFWGYKHKIEQPLSYDVDSIGVKQLPLEIKAPVTRSLMMGVSVDLNGKDHRKEIEGLGNVYVQFTNSRQQLELGLPQPGFHIIYFYCHGGRSQQTTWLEFGNKEALAPSDLMALEIRWQNEHPFVFINGCHTADVTPDDFLPFNDAFAYSEAAGVLGTEISIKETLARYFGKGFLQRFLGGMNVGDSIREQRLIMLKNYNLLGLAYTPYCSADLKIIPV